MVVKLRLNKTENNYELILSGVKGSVILFSGGYSSIDDDLLELGKNYERFDDVTEDFILERGPLENFDFNIWYWMDVIDKKEVKKYCFSLKNLNLKVRKEDMPVENKNYVIKKIRQTDHNKLTVTFFYKRIHEFDITTKGVAIDEDPDKELDKVITDIISQLYIQDWLAKNSLKEYEKQKKHVVGLIYSWLKNGSLPPMTNRLLGGLIEQIGLGFYRREYEELLKKINPLGYQEYLKTKKIDSYISMKSDKELSEVEIWNKMDDGERINATDTGDKEYFRKLSDEIWDEVVGEASVKANKEEGIDDHKETARDR